MEALLIDSWRGRGGGHELEYTPYNGVIDMMGAAVAIQLQGGWPSELEIRILQGASKLRARPSTKKSKRAFDTRVRQMRSVFLRGILA